jgi:cytochrome P450
VDVTCDQLSSFLFAGHDTTSTLMSWAFYELSRTPHALRAVRAELDELFGPDTDPAAVHSKLLGPGGKELIHRMSYTMAVIKETLRLWPPGATSRMTEPGDGSFIHTPNGELCIDGIMCYHIHSIIQRDPKVFGDTADNFVPERWLDNTDNIPSGAFRAFERGPRNCIGQELATIEARILIALTARRFDFTKVGRGAVTLDDAGNPTIGEHGQYRVESEMYMVSCSYVLRGCAQAY